MNSLRKNSAELECRSMTIVGSAQDEGVAVDGDHLIVGVASGEGRFLGIFDHVEVDFGNVVHIEGIPAMSHVASSREWVGKIVDDLVVALGEDIHYLG